MFNTNQCGFEFLEYREFVLTKLVNHLAKINDVPIVVKPKWFNDYLKKVHPKLVTEGVYISSGGLYLIDDMWKAGIALHELVHILSVPKEYRHMISYDTESSYKEIRVIYADTDKTMRESAVIGACAVISENMELQSYLGGSFFSGFLYNNSSENSTYSDVDKEWIERGNKLLEKVNFNLDILPNSQLELTY